MPGRVSPGSPPAGRSLLRRPRLPALEEGLHRILGREHRRSLLLRRAGRLVAVTAPGQYRAAEDGDSQEPTPAATDRFLSHRVIDSFPSGGHSLVDVDRETSIPGIGVEPPTL